MFPVSQRTLRLFYFSIFFNSNRTISVYKCDKSDGRLCCQSERRRSEPEAVIHPLDQKTSLRGDPRPAPAPLQNRTFDRKQLDSPPVCDEDLRLGLFQSVGDVLHVRFTVYVPADDAEQTSAVFINSLDVSFSFRATDVLLF